MRLRALQGFAARPLRQHVKAPSTERLCHPPRRCLVTLAIESSCDDTSVAVAEIPWDEPAPLTVHFHEKISAESDAYLGIHPLVALSSHRQNLAPLVQRALECSPRPDLVAATRGPGMRSNLAVGLDTAKGLALGLNVPFLGIHHMQAHTLTSRLVAAMDDDVLTSTGPSGPEFPFLTVLASGGHTMLINSKDLVRHAILAETQDIALGDCLDKAARAILPPNALKTPFGKALEDFAFPSGLADYQYAPPARRQEELQARRSKWNWALSVPLSQNKGGNKNPSRMIYSFTGLLSSVERLMTQKVDGAGNVLTETRAAEDVSLDERRTLAREVQRVAFEHLASRVLLHLSSLPASKVPTVVVVSGGVASNLYLRYVLRDMLDTRGYGKIDLAFPPVSLCTDNGLMIAWAAFEMWRAGYRSALDIEPIRKWSMDPIADDGGIIGVGGWIKER